MSTNKISSKIAEALIVSVSLSDNNTGVLVVGKKAPGKDVQVINAFQGEEAWNLYNKLTKKNVEA